MRPSGPWRGRRRGCAPPVVRPGADSRPHRCRSAYVIFQIGLRPAPVRFEQAVSAVPRDGYRFHAGADGVGHPGERGKRRQHIGELGQVVAGEPEPVHPSGFVGVEREHHHAAGHAPHLAQPRRDISPVVHGGDRHRGVEGLVLERQLLRGGVHARRRTRGPLTPHHRRRLDRDHVAIGRFIGAGAGPDVQHRPGVAECVPDLRGDPRLGTPGRGVSAADRVVQPCAEQRQLLLRCHCQPPRPCRQFPVDGRHHGVGAITPLQQQLAQSVQVRYRVGGRVVHQVRDLSESETQASVGQHLAQPLHVAR